MRMRSVINGFSRWGLIAIVLAFGLGCPPLSTCASDTDCQPGATCGFWGVGGTSCAPITCTGDASVCPQGSFCWPPPSGTPDDLFSSCLAVTPCKGGSLFDAPACSQGDCDGGLDGLVCGVVGGVGDDGQDILICGCVPEPLL